VILAASAFAGLVLLAFLLGLYFLPTIIAKRRAAPNIGSIAVINAFFGWTLVGWVVALAMAARTVPSPSASVGAETPRPPAEPKTESASAADEIEHLAALQAQGALSDKEFQAAKARLRGL
jgi:hypothetical protein